MKPFEPEPGRQPAAPDSAPLAREERRTEPRYVPVTVSVYIGWWENESFRAELGLLRNVSTTGAAVDIDADLSAVDTVWLCIVGPGRVTWAPARLAGHEGRLARLQFPEPFPYELFELLVWGFPAQDTGPPPSEA